MVFTPNMSAWHKYRSAWHACAVLHNAKPLWLRADGAPAALRALPRQGASANDVKRALQRKEAEDMRFTDGESHVSGGCHRR
jgi:hypothetical protein